ncbi:short chain dehydrogenase [Phytophthora infestans]|uniref:Short chain dehydrogenase n=1 Tax=Phytophthora infestans TaxID=4787 RepID=A0A833SN71_PHYIN|nr:short chain dehydrogenase [Phytophthora infestans]
MATTKKTVLITGSTRSIGLSLAKYYTKANWNVIGTARPSSNTDQLNALSPFKVVTLDTIDEASILEAARQVDGVPIDLLINNAGIWIPDTFESATKEALMRQFEVNAVGPFLTTRALLPNLELAAKSTALPMSRSISSNTAEMDNFFSKAFGYAPSKAALNMATRSMSVSLRHKDIGFVTLNPGYVATDMNEHQGYLTPEESAESMAKIVEKLILDDTGKFYNADKQYPAVELPW